MTLAKAEARVCGIENLRGRFVFWPCERLHTHSFQNEARLTCVKNLYSRDNAAIMQRHGRTTGLPSPLLTMDQCTAHNCAQARAAACGTTRMPSALSSEEPQHASEPLHPPNFPTGNPTQLPHRLGPKAKHGPAAREPSGCQALPEKPKANAKAKVKAKAMASS